MGTNRICPKIGSPGGLGGNGYRDFLKKVRQKIADIVIPAAMTRSAIDDTPYSNIILIMIKSSYKNIDIAPRSEDMSFIKCEVLPYNSGLQQQHVLSHLFARHSKSSSGNEFVNKTNTSNENKHLDSGRSTSTLWAVSQLHNVKLDAANESEILFDEAI